MPASSSTTSGAFERRRFYMPKPLKKPGPLAARVGDRLRNSAGFSASFESLAQGLGVHPRTLRRQLRDEGTSYLQLRHRARTELALHLLGDVSLSHEQIASRLGLCDGSSFRRAFRRWTGKSPATFREYREIHR